MVSIKEQKTKMSERNSGTISPRALVNIGIDPKDYSDTIFEGFNCQAVNIKMAQSTKGQDECTVIIENKEEKQVCISWKSGIGLRYKSINKNKIVHAKIPYGRISMWQWEKFQQETKVVPQLTDVLNCLYMDYLTVLEAAPDRLENYMQEIGLCESMNYNEITETAQLMRENSQKFLEVTSKISFKDMEEFFSDY